MRALAMYRSCAGGMGVLRGGSEQCEEIGDGKSWQ